MNHLLEKPDMQPGSVVLHDDGEVLVFCGYDNCKERETRGVEGTHEQ